MLRKFYAAGHSMMDYKSELRTLPVLLVFKTEHDSIEDAIAHLEAVMESPDRSSVSLYNKLNKLAVIIFQVEDDGSVTTQRKVNANDRMEKDEEQYAKALRKMGNTHLLLEDGTQLRGNAPDYAANAQRNLRALLQKGEFVPLDEYPEEIQELIVAIEDNAQVIFARDDDGRAAINAMQAAWHTSARQTAEQRIKNKKEAEKVEKEKTAAQESKVEETENAEALAEAFAEGVEEAIEQVDEPVHDAPERIDESPEAQA